MHGQPRRYSSGFHSVRHGRLLQVANRLKAPLAKLKNNAISRSLALLLVALASP